MLRPVAVALDDDVGQPRRHGALPERTGLSLRHIIGDGLIEIAARVADGQRRGLKIVDAADQRMIGGVKTEGKILADGVRIGPTRPRQDIGQRQGVT